MNVNWYLAYEMFKQREAEMLRRLDRTKQGVEPAEIPSPMKGPLRMP